MQQLSISFVIIPVEATRIVYKTCIFDVDKRIIALRHSDYSCAADIQSQLVHARAQRITKTTLLRTGNTLFGNTNVLLFNYT